MQITGNIIKIKNNDVYIKQFYTGYIYRVARGNIKIQLNRDGSPKYINNKLIAFVTGVGSENVAADYIKEI